jgi:hypothetical protein
MIHAATVADHGLRMCSPSRTVDEIRAGEQPLPASRRDLAPVVCRIRPPFLDPPALSESAAGVARADRDMGGGSLGMHRRG